MTDLMADKKLILHWILRVAVFMEFVGHGAFGIIGKEAWLPYIEMWGFSTATAWKLMPLVGGIDILLGIVALIYPVRFVFAYMTVWGLFTAALRPLSGESFFELIERSYNFGMPFAFLILHGFGSDLKSLFVRVAPDSLQTSKISDGLRKHIGLSQLFLVVIVMMLLGHGALGLVTEKQGLMKQYSILGLPVIFNMSALAVMQIIGAFEIGLAVFAVFSRSATLFLFIALWKVLTESFFILTNAYGASWEFIERGGAYFAPIGFLIALSMAMKSSQASTSIGLSLSSVRL